MTQARIPVRPASVAIAATLAALSTPGLAQEAAPPVLVTPTAPVAAPAPAPVAAPPLLVAPAPTAPMPTVDTADADPVQRPMTRKTNPVATPRVAAATKPAATAPAATGLTPAATPPAPTEAAPVPAPAERTPAPLARSANNGSTDSDGAPWIVGGGIAVLALAGAAFALRRRRADEDVADGMLVREAPFVPLAAEPAPMIARTTFDRQPVATESAAPLRKHAMAPTGNSNLENMVAAPPSEANPFLTRRNRIRRAKFLLDHGQAPSDMVGNTATETVRQPTAQQQDRSQTYSFSGGKQRYGFTPQPA